MITEMSTRRAASVATTAWPDDDRSRADLDHFIRARGRMFAIAYRIVGNVPEAEDVLQEVWLGWQRVDRTVVSNPEAFLVTLTGRLAINLVRSACRRHETPVAASFPDEVDYDADPQRRGERGEDIAQAVHLLLERLPPCERAAYVLREGFEFPYRQIAAILQIGAANARQLVKRARGHLVTGRRRPVGPAVRGRLGRAFTAASCGGDLTGLESLLAADMKRPRCEVSLTYADVDTARPTDALVTAAASRAMDQP